MTEYGFRCTYCGEIVKFDIDLRADKDHMDYGKRITNVNSTCSYCGKRVSMQPYDDMIIGGSDAIVQTPKVIIEQAIEDLNWINVKDSPSWERLCDALTRLEKVKEKLPEF